MDWNGRYKNNEVLSMNFMEDMINEYYFVSHFERYLSWTSYIKIQILS